MEAELVELKPIVDPRGRMVVLDNHSLPFPLKRAFYTFDVPRDAERGGHAHRTCHELLVAVSGSVWVKANDTLFRLCSPYQGLYIPPGVFVTLKHFTSDCILLVLASEDYDPQDRIVQQFEARTLVTTLA